MKNPLRITAALSLFVLVACASEKKDFEKMKPEIDPIIAEMTPLAADLAKARKDSAPPSSTDAIQRACAAAQKSAEKTHFDVLMYRAGKAKDTAIAFQSALAEVAAITTPDVGEMTLILRWDSSACEKAADDLCAASAALSQAAKSNGVAIEPICK